jgi:hypothetical protein
MKYEKERSAWFRAALHSKNCLLGEVTRYLPTALGGIPHNHDLPISLDRHRTDSCNHATAEAGRDPASVAKRSVELSAAQVAGQSKRLCRLIASGSSLSCRNDVTVRLNGNSSGSGLRRIGEVCECDSAGSEAGVSAPV